MSDKKLRVAFHTLGCKLNFAETSTIARTLPVERFNRVSFNEAADIYIINTCSVTDLADKKCRQAIKKVTSKNPRAYVAVVGCYAQLNPGEIASIPGVDLVLGNTEKFNIPAYIGNLEKKSAPEIHSCEIEGTDSVTPSWSVGDRTRSFLKVQDGCDYKCSYCTIPLARGKSRNIPVAECVNEALKIASSGVREIVLTGVNTGDFGKSTGETFTALVNELMKVPGIERYRISSIEPNLLSDEIIELAASGGKLMPHFHIPLQSGCNKILSLMQRRYRRELFADRVMKLRTKMPLAGIGCDVITGFPGETDEDFNDTYDFLSSLSLSYLHVFRFSERPGTVAASLAGKVAHEVKEKRSHQLIRLSQSKKMSFCLANSGRTEPVLFEKSGVKGFSTGFTPNYLKVLVPESKGITGTVRRVRLSNPSEEGNIFGELEIL